MKRKKFLTLLPGIFTVLIFITWTVNADTLPVFPVPSFEYPTIQDGINAAALVEGGGRVLVAPGTYNADSGEIFPIILPSGVELINAGPGVCVLDAKGSSSVISCTGDSISRIEGFLIINGGGGLGAGIICEADSSPEIVNNIIVGVRALWGGGIVCGERSSPQIINNTIVNNSASYGGGIYCLFQSSPTITNNIIFSNNPGGIYCHSISSPVISFNDVYDNNQNYYNCTVGPGDISVDPDLVYFKFDTEDPDYTTFDFHLEPYSLCVDAGTNLFFYQMVYLFDFEGNPRRLDGGEKPPLGDEPAMVDIGADEFVPPPVARAGDDQTVSADENGEATVTLDGTDSSDPGEETLSYEWKDSSDEVIGDTAEVTVTLGLGTHTFTLTVSSVNGTGTDEVKIIVEDTTPPVPDEGTLPTVEGECLAEVTTVPTATDNCSGVLVGETDDLLVYDEQGTYTVTWTYTDESGNSTQQIQTVIVRDVTAPVPDAVTLPAVEGECSVEINEAPTATDNCAGSITGTTTDPVSYTTKGTHTIRWTYNDGNGNITEQTQTVIVRDVTAPVPDAATLPNVEGECSVEVTTAPTATDNCAGTITATTTDPLSYTEAGTYTITWTYDDGNGNSVTQTQTVIVRDVTAPVPDAATLPILEGDCSVEITTVPTATDNCAGSITGTTTAPLPLVFTENGTHTVVWTYDDGNGNIATQTQTVKIKDITPPTILLSESTCVEINKWSNVNILTVSASDNCSSEVELTIDKVEIFNKRGHRVWGNGTYRVVGNGIYVNPNGNDWSICVTATATDGSGNTRTDRLCQPLLRCNRWSEHMARMIWMLFQLLMRHHHCW